MSVVAVSPLLRRALLADASISAVVGVVLTAAAATLEGLLQLPYSLLMAAGVVLFPWAACLFWMARKPELPRAAVWAVIAINVAWIVESAWVALGGAYAPNALGQTFIVLQALGVAVLAEWEFMGLRRANRMALA